MRLTSALKALLAVAAMTLSSPASAKGSCRDGSHCPKEFICLEGGKCGRVVPFVDLLEASVCPPGTFRPPGPRNNCFRSGDRVCPGNEHSCPPGWHCYGSGCRESSKRALRTTFPNGDWCPGAAVTLLDNGVCHPTAMITNCERAGKSCRWPLSCAEDGTCQSALDKVAQTTARVDNDGGSRPSDDPAILNDPSSCLAGPHKRGSASSYYFDNTCRANLRYVYTVPSGQGGTKATPDYVSKEQTGSLIISYHGEPTKIFACVSGQAGCTEESVRALANRMNGR